MSLPPEILHEIILVSLSSSTKSEETGVSTKHNWASIEPLTLASKAYRNQTLNAWFRTLYAKTPSDIVDFESMFPEISGVTRELHCVQPNTRKSSVWDLSGLKYIRKIRLDWLSPYMTPHYGSKNTSDRLPFTHASPTIKELDIRGIPWPSPNVFLNIHTIFPNLNVLRLRQQRIWCGLCHTCCITRFSSPGPEKLVYTGGGGLPLHYARVLRELQHLHTVSITIADFGGGRFPLWNTPGQNPYLWAGECDSCMEIMYEDESFRDHWVASKKDITSNRYLAPPTLNEVEWNFWRAEASEEVDVEESSTEESAEEAL